jgi:hypothetical protein
MFVASSGGVATMRPAKVLLVLVISSAAAFGATTLSKGDAGPQERAPRDWDYPRPGSSKATPRPQPQPQVLNDALAQYAEECAAATRIAVPDLTCRKGELVGGQKMDSDRRCRAPDVLNAECDPGSRFQVLSQNDEAAVVAHCRKREAKPGEFYEDIAIIQYNKKNGAICFFQALDKNLPGNSIPSPSKGRIAWSDNKSRWMTPKETYDGGCTGCHDNGGFIRTPYILQTKKQILPNSKDGYGNLDNPLAYVGKAFAKARSWTIEIAEGPTCTGCHRMAVSNHERVIDTVDSSEIITQLGSALAFGVISTAKEQVAKTPHGEVAPDGQISKIWMPPNRTNHSPAMEAAAREYRRCAREWIKSGFTQEPAGCTIKEFAGPFKETD